MKKDIKITMVLIVLTLLSTFQLPIHRVQAVELPLEIPCFTVESEQLQVSESDNNQSSIVLPNLLFMFFAKAE